MNRFEKKQRLARKYTFSIILIVVFHLFQTSQAMISPTGQLNSVEALTQTAKNILNDLFNADYQTTQEISIVIPQTKHEIHIDLKIRGSEDLLAPMPSGTCNIRSLDAKTVSPDSPFSFTDFGKILLQDEITAQAKQFSLLQWLNTATLSPIKIFTIKLFLLVKDSHKFQTPDLVIKELIRLLIKLSLVEDLEILDKTKPLSGYFPELIKEKVKNYMPEMLDIMDGVWLALVSGTSITSPIAQAKTVHAFAFKSELLAKSCFELLKKSHPETDIASTVQNFIVSHSSTLVSFVDFEKIKSGHHYIAQKLQDAGVNIGNINPIQKIVTHVTYDASSESVTTGIPAELKIAIASQTTTPAVVMAKTADGNHWVGYVTDQFTFKQSLKLLSICLIKTVKDYAATRPVNAENKIASQEQQKKDLKIEAFFKTELGLKSKAHLDKALEQIEKMGVTPPLKSTQEADKKHLNDLKDIALGLKSQGDIISPELQDMINSLEEKLSTQDFGSNGTKMSLEQRLEKRTLVAQAYEQEAILIKKMLEQLQAKINNKIWPSEIDKKIEEIKFEALTKAPAMIYAEHLENLALQIRSENKKMSDLQAYRLSPILTDDHKVLKQELEQQIGALLDDRATAIKSFTDYLGVTGDLNTLITDISNNDMYKHIKEQLLSNLAQIIQKSGYIKPRIRTCQYLVAHFTPEFLPLFNQALEQIS